ncbi:Uncharacterized protein AArcCO_4115 (plasmid) [Halalkaliarchaeum sp. AArc-CO]|uniref:hypothetical protein n=1 Tax=Halalkaliarchaeum sp. AArc-CO TaxID=2866381 RepID=UPI00217DF1A6|nr:hypothetical protein [Halalkaliarchaeum sp. AArc-CO]UWG49290.1 Uncharacterized protein AArcCO_4115 [Halalkaliarchaeum sp. AArc-CO]
MQYDTLMVRDPDMLDPSEEIPVRQVRLETPRGTTIALTNQHNQWTGALTGVAPLGDTPAAGRGGLRRVGRRDPVEVREAWEHRETEGAAMTDCRTVTEELQMHLAQAATRVENPDARTHVEAALDAAVALPLTPLVECPVCGRVGLPERIETHPCTGELVERRS